MSVSSGGSALPVIQYTGHCVTQVTNSRLLGAIVDDELFWNEHVDVVCSKLARKIGALRRNFSPTDLHLQDNVYFISVIQPDLEYQLCLLSCRVCQNSIGITYMVRWRKAIRCAAGLGYQDSVDKTVKRLHMMKIECRWALQFAMIVRCCH